MDHSVYASAVRLFLRSGVGAYPNPSYVYVVLGGSTSLFVAAWHATFLHPLSGKTQNMEQPPKKRRRGEVEQLSPEKLRSALDSAVLSQGNAELAFLFLIDQYDFDLKSRLEGLPALISSIRHGV